MRKGRCDWGTQTGYRLYGDPAHTHAHTHTRIHARKHTQEPTPQYAHTSHELKHIQRACVYVCCIHVKSANSHQRINPRSGY